MAENPLLPNAELQALHTWTKRAQSLLRKQTSTLSDPSSIAGREALLAGTLMQLRPGDALVTEPGDTTAFTLIASQSPAPHPITILQPPQSDQHLLSAAGLAAANKRSGTDCLTFAFTRAGLTSTTWPDALTWAQSGELPLILAIADPVGPEAYLRNPNNDPAALTWGSLQKLSRKIKLPVLTVDGEDAVAVYRVMQESVLRARSGAGPAVLWALLPTPHELATLRPPSVSPLRRLERYLRTRKIPF